MVMEGVELILPFVKEEEAILKSIKTLVKGCLEDAVDNVREAARSVVSKYPVVSSLCVCLTRVCYVCTNAGTIESIGICGNWICVLAGNLRVSELSIILVK